MSHYIHLSIEEREQSRSLLENEKSIREIGKDARSFAINNIT